MVLKGHEGAVIALAWSPRGDFLASGSVDATVRLWPIVSSGDIDTAGSFILESHATYVTALSWSPSSMYLASGSAPTEGAIIIWKFVEVNGTTTIDDEPRRLGSTPFGVGALSWSPTGALLASSGMVDGSVGIWRILDDDETLGFSAQELTNTGAEDSMRHLLQWSPTGRHLASATGSVIRLWPVAPDGSVEDDGMRILSCHTTTIWSMAWSPTGDRLLTSSSDMPIHVWAVCPDTFASARRRVWLMGHTPLVNVVAWNPVDIDIFVAGNGDGSLAIWSRNGSLVSGISNAGPNVRAVAWSPDGQILAVGSFDHTGIAVFEFDLDARVILTESRRHLSGHYGAVYALAWSPDGSVLASGGIDATVRLWCRHSTPISVEDDNVPFNRSRSSTLFGEDYTLFGHMQQVTSLAYAPRNNSLAMMLASGGADGTIRLWNVRPDRLNSTTTAALLNGHEGWVRCLAWSGDQLASAGDDRTIIIWKIPTTITTGDASNIESQFIYEVHTSWIMSVAWSPNGEMLASGSRDGNVAVWRTTSDSSGRSGSIDVDAALAVLEGHTDWVRSVAWESIASENGQWLLLSGGWDNTVRLWMIDDGEGDEGQSTSRATEVVAPAMVMTDPHHNWAYVVPGPKPDEDLLSNRDTLPVALWGVRSPFCAATQIPQLLDGHVTVWVSTVVWSPDGTHIASAGPDADIQLWRVDTDGDIVAVSTQAIPKRPGGRAQPLAWSPSSLHLATAGGRETTIRVWGVVADGKVATTPVISLTGHTGRVLSLAWAPSMYCLASGSSDGAIRVWSLSRALYTELLGVQVIHQASTLGINTLAWSPVGNILAAGDDGGDVITWTTEALSPDEPSAVANIESVRVLSGHGGPVLSLSWCAGGTLLASGSSDSTVRVWERRGDGMYTDAIAVLMSNTVGRVTTVAWSPDSCELATGATDGTIRLWRPWHDKMHCRENDDFGDGSFDMRVEQVLRGASDTWVNSMAWNPEGGRLISASNEPPLSVWTVGLEPIREAFDRAFTNRLHLELTSSDYASHAFLEGLVTFGEESQLNPDEPDYQETGYEAATPIADR